MKRYGNPCAIFADGIIDINENMREAINSTLKTLILCDVKTFNFG